MRAEGNTASGPDSALPPVWSGKRTTHARSVSGRNPTIAKPGRAASHRAQKSLSLKRKQQACRELAESPRDLPPPAQKLKFSGISGTSRPDVSASPGSDCHHTEGACRRFVQPCSINSRRVIGSSSHESGVGSTNLRIFRNRRSFAGSFSLRHRERWLSLPN